MSDCCASRGRGGRGVWVCGVWAGGASEWEWTVGPAGQDSPEEDVRLFQVDLGALSEGKCACGWVAGFAELAVASSEQLFGVCLAQTVERFLAEGQSVRKFVCWGWGCYWLSGRGVAVAAGDRVCFEQKGHWVRWD